MKNLKKYISILNWVDAKFSFSQLIKLQTNDESLEKELARLSEAKRTELKKVYYSVEQALQNNYKIICCTSDHYPSNLKKVFSNPVPLMHKGDFGLDKFNFGVVGSRRPQQTTSQWLSSELYEALIGLKSEGKHLNIFSGGAYGIDQLAHKTALLSGVPTTCFLPTGVNNCYPRSLKVLVESIINNGGALVTPFPPDFPVYKSNFYFRNKILVLLSDIILIAEARRRSGTMMTANMALSSGKPIVAVPQAPIKNCLGSLDLIDSGVPMVRCKKDLSYAIGQLNF